MPAESNLQVPSPVARERLVRVFISSTFRDMHAERDYLVKFTFPELRKLCESRGVTWGEVDLRWGVTDEQKADGEVLPICLEEIRRCRPYFIGLLGERYGWIPEKISEDLLDRESWLREQLRGRKSVTELEIIHGVLREEKRHRHAYFYFRDPHYVETVAADKRPEFTAENAECAEKLHRLKAEVRRARDEQVCQLREDYRDPRQLGDWIREDFTRLIDQLFPEGSQLHPLDREALDHESYAQRRERVYIGRPEYFTQLDTYANGTGNQPLVILGDSGSGKSALLANWVAHYRQQHPDALVVQHYIGATPYSADWAVMLRRIMGEFKRRLGIQQDIPDKPDALRSAFANWLHMAAAKGRGVLVLDALNQLEDRDGAPDIVWLPPVMPANVRLIVSTLPGRPLNEINRRKWPTMTVKPLDVAERKHLIAEYLTQSAKHLGPTHLDRIASAPQAANPLYLRVLLDELRLFGHHQGLAECIGDYMQATSVHELYAKVLARYEADYERDRPRLVHDTLTLLWIARQGLSEVELLILLRLTGQERLPAAVWAPFRCALQDGLVDRGGLLSFSHEHLRKAVERRYFADSHAEQTARFRLAEYLERQSLSPRKAIELPWQLWKSGDSKRLLKVLLDVDLTAVAIYGRTSLEWESYWHSIPGWREAILGYRESLEAAALAHGKSEHLAWLFKCVAWLLDEFGAKGDSLTQTAVALQERAIAIHNQVAGSENEAFVDLLHGLIEYLIHMDRPNDAISVGERALKLHEHLFGCEDPRIGTSLNNLGAALFYNCDLSRAQSIMERNAALVMKAEVRNPRDVLQVTFSLGCVHLEQGNFEDALSLLSEAHEMAVTYWGATSPQILPHIEKIGQLWQKRGRLEKALSFYTSELEIARTVLGNGHSRVGKILVYMANVYREKGDFGKAIGLLEEETQITRETDGELSESMCRSLDNLGRYYFFAGRREESVATLTKALKIAESCLDPLHPLTGFIRQNLLKATECPIPPAKVILANNDPTELLANEAPIAQIREAADLNFGKGNWEAAETEFRRLLMKGEPLPEVGPQVITCLLNAHEDLLAGDAAKIETLLGQLESAGHAALAAPLRQQFNAKRGVDKRPWWKIWRVLA